MSRREFLKDAGIVIGGAALASLALSGCKDTKTSVAATTAATPVTSVATSTPPSTPPASTAPATDTSTTPPPSSSPAATATTPPITFKSTYTSLLDTPGCALGVAPDRLYSLDHAWAKDLGNNVVGVGITDHLQILLGLANTCYIPPPGTRIKANESFGSVEGTKISVDLISPVSGTVLQNNPLVISHPAPYLNGDPYNSGWMMIVQMSNPDELKNLVSPAYYRYLTAETWTGTVPPMR